MADVISSKSKTNLGLYETASFKSGNASRSNRIKSANPSSKSRQIGNNRYSTSKNTPLPSNPISPKNAETDSQCCGFELEKYHSQKYNVGGFPIPRKLGATAVNSSILKQEINYPKGWGTTNAGEPKMSRTTLLERRKNEVKADPSYDINGDGTVGAREFFVARRFDSNKDGVLEEDERQECLKALKDGWEEAFLFGLEAGGGTGASQGAGKQVLGERIQQIEGKLIKDGDLSVLHDVKREVDPSKIRSLSQLKERRKQETKEHTQKGWDRRFFLHEEMIRLNAKPSAVCEIGLKPREDAGLETKVYTDAQQKKEMREVNGLDPTPDCDLVQESERRMRALKQRPKSQLNHQIPLNYVKHPPMTTKAQLNTIQKYKLKKENDKTFKQLQSQNYKDEIQRIQDRERGQQQYLHDQSIKTQLAKALDQKLRPKSGVAGEKTNTQKQLLTRRKMQMIKENQEKFGNFASGVHGHELPRYGDLEDKRYWKLKADYNPKTPAYQSVRLMGQDRKYWAKNDEMYLGDTRLEENPGDTFKENRVIEKKSTEIPEKALTQNFIDKYGRCQTKKNSKTKEKWSGVEHKLRKKFSENVKPAQIYISDENLMPSSFSRNGVFLDPKDSGDRQLFNKRQEEKASNIKPSKLNQLNAKEDEPIFQRQKTNVSRAPKSQMKSAILDASEIGSMKSKGPGSPTKQMSQASPLKRKSVDEGGSPTKVLGNLASLELQQLDPVVLQSLPQQNQMMFKRVANLTCTNKDSRMDQGLSFASTRPATQVSGKKKTSQLGIFAGPSEGLSPSKQKSHLSAVVSPNNLSMSGNQFRNTTQVGIRSSAFNHIGFEHTTITMPINDKLSPNKNEKTGNLRDRLMISKRDSMFSPGTGSGMHTQIINTSTDQPPPRSTKNNSTTNFNKL